MTEIQQLEEEFLAGTLAPIQRDLEAFLRTNRDKILEFKRRQVDVLGPNPDAAALAVKWYILEVKCINPVEEIRSELGEIEREIWYEGERQKRTADRLEVAREWCRRHAPGWRDHRVMTIIFVFEREKSRYLKILEGGNGEPPSN